MPENPVILVTGTSEGLGYETARLLAAGTTTVIAHARTPEESQAARDRLIVSMAKLWRISESLVLPGKRRR